MSHSGKFRVTEKGTIENSAVQWLSRPTLLREFKPSPYQIWHIKSGYMEGGPHVPSRYLVVKVGALVSESESEARVNQARGWTNTFVVEEEVEAGRFWRQTLANLTAEIEAEMNRSTPPPSNMTTLS